MKKIKSIIFTFFIFGFLFSASSANHNSNNKELFKSNCPDEQEQKEIQNSAKNPMPDKKCRECETEDDEYCVYNQCYFDKQYRLLKISLSPNNNQENCLDNIYMNFKQDLEILCDKYSKEKNKLLEIISLDNKSFKEQKNKVQDIKQDIKEKYKDYLSDTNEILCKNQRKAFRKFKRKQNKKIKKIKKYGAIYKFPCS